LFTVSDTFARHHHDFMRSCQEKVRHELETKGYVMYEATDDEEEEEEEEEEEAVAHQKFQGGDGHQEEEEEEGGGGHQERQKGKRSKH